MLQLYDIGTLDADQVTDEYLAYLPRFEPYVTDTSLLVNKALDEGREVLFEGAQGTLLDIDFGTYPFVTSSNPISGGACVGAGVGPTRIDNVVGVAKAYTTRVGEGPFPTELFDDVGAAHVRGRSRVRHHHRAPAALRLARPGGAALRRAGERRHPSGHHQARRAQRPRSVKVCTRYKAGRKVLDEFPVRQTDFHHAKPLFEELPGWTEDLRDCEEWAELPETARDYIQFIADFTKTRIKFIAVGPGRDETIVLPRSIGRGEQSRRPGAAVLAQARPLPASPEPRLQARARTATIAAPSSAGFVNIGQCPVGRSTSCTSRTLRAPPCTSGPSP